MSFDNIKTGKARRPPRVLLYGQEGIGKSTFAASAPSPIFVPTEDGIDEIECSSFPMATSLQEVIDNLDELIAREHSFETVVIDTADWLERLIHEEVCKSPPVAAIELAAGGFGKGYGIALNYWREILEQLDRLRNQKNMVVILLAHARQDSVEDPESAASYDRWIPRLNDSKNSSSLALISEWCDAVLFATRRIRIATEDLGFNKKRSTAVAIGKDGGDRIIRPYATPAALAKNRYGLTSEIPLSWAAFVDAIAANQS